MSPKRGGCSDRQKPTFTPKTLQEVLYYLSQLPLDVQCWVIHVLRSCIIRPVPNEAEAQRLRYVITAKVEHTRIDDRRSRSELMPIWDESVKSVQYVLGLIETLETKELLIRLVGLALKRQGLQTAEETRQELREPQSSKPRRKSA